MDALSLEKSCSQETTFSSVGFRRTIDGQIPRAQSPGNPLVHHLSAISMAPDHATHCGFPKTERKLVCESPGWRRAEDRFSLGGIPRSPATSPGHGPDANVSNLLDSCDHLIRGGRKGYIGNRPFWIFRDLLYPGRQSEACRVEGQAIELPPSDIYYNACLDLRITGRGFECNSGDAGQLWEYPERPARPGAHVPFDARAAE